MGIFNFFNKSVKRTRFEMVTERGNSFVAWNGKVFDNDIVKSCIRPKYKAMGKLVAKHIRNNIKDGVKINPDAYMRFLLEEPNPLMSMQMLIEKAVIQLELNNNAFIYIHRDEYGYPIELYNIPCVSCEAIYDNNYELFLKCTNLNGKTITYPYKDVIHLRKDFNTNDIFGESPIRALAPLMEIVTTTDQGIVKAIKNGSVIKWLLKFNQSLRPEDIKKQTDDFVKDYLSIDNNLGGAAATDVKYDAKQVEPKDYVPNSAQFKETINRIYNFFGTNEKIVQGKYNEDEWISYYESEIEPLAIQFSNEFTRKLFTRKERGFGNRIIFETSNLQYASIKTKLDLVQMVDRGALTPNEWRNTLGLSDVDNGDKLIRRLDTATVKGGDE